MDLPKVLGTVREDAQTVVVSVCDVLVYWEMNVMGDKEEVVGEVDVDLHASVTGAAKREASNRHHPSVP